MLDTTKKTLLTNAAYDRLKFLAQVLLPGVASLYYGLSGYWDLPKADEVVGSIALIDTFLGLFLAAGAKRYMNSDDRFDGSVLVESVDANDEHEGYSNVNIQVNPDAITSKGEVVLKVKDVSNIQEH